MAERRLGTRMGLLAQARDSMLRTNRLVRQLVDASPNLTEHVERNLEYLCSPEAADAAAFEEWEDMPALEDAEGAITFEAEF